MNYELTPEQKQAVLDVALFLEKTTVAELQQIGVYLDADAIFHYDEDKDIIVTDIGGLVAYVFWETDMEPLVRGGHLAAFIVWNERTGLDGGFYEKFTCLDDVWDAGIDAKSITPDEYGRALREFVGGLPGPFSWSRLIEEKINDEEEDENDDGLG